jgi:diaminohydroxyphosphoribosylaminopyrimidine deaminase/5-amino-6-(5-phosphoribosylamino)uracil reductase
MDFTPEDKKVMRRALSLAKRGWGTASPNPMVGAVIVKGGKIVGEGFHREAGLEHGEIQAIRNAGESNCEGATLYTNLEPCGHHGKTPPCVESIVKAGIKRVIYSLIDPNPLVSGKGVRFLKERGVETKEGLLTPEATELNEAYLKYVSTGLPFVTVKVAQTLDSRIATKSGDSRWISSEPSLRFSHRLRAGYDAVLVGSGTVARDNPRLTVRLVKGRSPLRIILSSKGQLPPDSNQVKLASDGKTVVTTTGELPPNLATSAVKFWKVGDDGGGRVDWHQLLKFAGKREITSILIEGGASVITSALKASIVDKIIVVVAPLLLGQGVEAIGDLKIDSVKEALRFQRVKVKHSGPDLIYIAYPKYD